MRKQEKSRNNSFASLVTVLLFLNSQLENKGSNLILFCYLSVKSVMDFPAILVGLILSIKTEITQNVQNAKKLYKLNNNKKMKILIFNKI